MRVHEEINVLHFGDGKTEIVKNIEPGLGVCDESLVGRPAVYKPTQDWGVYKKGTEYPCMVLFGSTEGNQEGGIDPVFIVEFPDGTVNHFSPYQLRFTDVQV